MTDHIVVNRTRRKGAVRRSCVHLTQHRTQQCPTHRGVK